MRSREPLWDQPELRDMGVRIHRLRLTLAAGHDTVGTSVVDAEPESVLAMPEHTYVPLVTALGITVLFVGFLTLLYPVMALGGLVMVLGMLAWLRPKELPG